MSSRRPGAAPLGFTLLEVLVAMTVLALALGSSLAAVIGSSDRVAHIEESTVAFWVAQNALTSLRMRPSSSLGASVDGLEPMAGRQWYWRADIQKTADKATHRVEVEVFRERAGTRPAASLSGFLPGPGP